MRWKGDRDALWQVCERARLIKEGSPHDHLRPALLVLGGGMKTIFASKILWTWRKKGLLEGFEHVVGVSAGTLACASAYIGQTELGPRAYWRTFAGNGFINPLRIMRIMNLSLVMRPFLGKRGVENIEKLRHSSPTGFHVLLTEFDTASPVMVNLKDQESSALVANAIEASITLPVFSGLNWKGSVRRVHVGGSLDGKAYLDGGIAEPLPSKLVCETLNPTALVVISNWPIYEPETFAERYLFSLVYSFLLPEPICEAISEYQERFDAGRKFLRESNMPYHLFYPDQMIGTFDRNSLILLQAARRTSREMRQYLRKYHEDLECRKDLLP